MATTIRCQLYRVFGDEVAIIDHGETLTVRFLKANQKSDKVKRLVFPERQEAIVASESSETIEFYLMNLRPHAH